MKFKEGLHIVNHFSNSRIFTFKNTTLDTLENLNLNMQSSKTPVSEIYSRVNEFFPDTFRLDMVSDLVKFLNYSDEGLWLVKSSVANQGKGIEMVNDIKKYKQDLLDRKDKWGDN
jgi:hypothetical protein